MNEGATVSGEAVVVLTVTAANSFSTGASWLAGYLDLWQD